MIYSLTFMMGVLFRSGRTGIRGAIGFIFCYGLLVQGAGVPLPTFMPLLEKATSAQFNPAQYAYPYALAAAWLAVALSMAVVAYARFRHHEP